MPAPLAGKRILDLGACCDALPQALAIAMTGRLCAAYGAAVHRPRPAHGEMLADAAPLLPDGRSALDLFLNAGKSADAAGRYDAAIGTAALLGQHAAAVPVQVRVSAYGPDRDVPESELALLALSGLLGLVGERGGVPARLAGHQLAYAAGLAATTGLIAALFAGGTEVVDVALFDVAVWLNWKLPASLLLLGPKTAGGPARSHWMTVPARDGHIALVYQQKDWSALRAMVGDPRLDHPDFATMAARGRNWDRLLAILGPWFAARSRTAITAAAQARRIPIGPVLFPHELLTDAHYAARGFLRADGAPRLPLVWDGARPEWEIAHVG